MFFLDENVKNSFHISLKFVPKGTINNIPALVQVMGATSHCLNQWWLIYWRIHASLGLNVFNGHIMMMNIDTWVPNFRVKRYTKYMYHVSSYKTRWATYLICVICIFHRYIWLSLNGIFVGTIKTVLRYRVKYATLVFSKFIQEIK